MGPVGVQEMVVIFLVALVLFGPKKLPELGKTIGKAITEFRRAQGELKATFDHHMRELEKEHESVKEVTRSFTQDVYNHYDSTVYDAANHTPAPPSSTEASSSTVGASATQGAEPAGIHPQPVNGAVARTTPEPMPTPHIGQVETAPESHSVNS